MVTATWLEYGLSVLPERVLLFERSSWTRISGSWDGWGVGVGIAREVYAEVAPSCFEK
jgi:hypothetical protein